MIQAETLHLILDISGSMREMGKLMLARNLVSYIREYSFQKVNSSLFSRIRLFTWNDKVHPVDLEDGKETPHFCATGKAAIDKLTELLDREASATPALKVIILSDGNFSNADLKSFCLWRKEQSNIEMRAVAIGSDASYSNLKELSTNNYTFPSENITVAVQSLSDVKDTILPPASINEVILISDSEDEEGWE